ncbi:MAG: response regulator [Pseudomonadales bacterium]|nr:response regulator [Pseudomonadales bacterium]
MPNMTGTQLAAEIHAVKPEIPVVLMTGKTDLLKESELTSIGKPFRVIELATKMSEAL